MSEPVVIGNATLHLGDCLDVMRTLPDNSVDSIVTDPPYGLSFMGKKWDYDVPSEAIWLECLRVLKPGGHLLAFAGTRTQHRMACRIEDAGFEIRDMIAWVYGSGFPKSLDVSKAIDKAAGAEREVVGVARRSQVASDGWDRPWKQEAMKNANSTIAEFAITAPATEAARQWQGWGTALKPALEPITMARKPFACTVAANVLQHGTGALNIDGCRIDGVPPSVPQPAFNSPTGQIFGFKTGEGRNGEMSESAGRWPANLIHDGSDEVLALFPESGAANIRQPGGEKLYGRNALLESKTVDTTVRGFEDAGGSAARFFYCAKASAEDRNEGCEAIDARLAGCLTMRNDAHAQANGQTFAHKHNHHPTVKPTDLMRYLLRLVTPPHGVALDPFLGSGSTGKAAMLEDFRFIGIERDPAYFAIACARLEHSIAQGSLFAPTPFTPSKHAGIRTAAGQGQMTGESTYGAHFVVNAEQCEGSSLSALGRQTPMSDSTSGVLL